MASRKLKTKIKLLSETKPTVITNEKEYEAALNQITDLSLKEDQIRPEELALLKLLAALVHEYESERWPRKRGKSTPAEMRRSNPGPISKRRRTSLSKTA